MLYTTPYPNDPLNVAAIEDFYRLSHEPGIGRQVFPGVMDSLCSLA